MGWGGGGGGQWCRVVNPRGWVGGWGGWVGWGGDLRFRGGAEFRGQEDQRGSGQGAGGRALNATPFPGWTPVARPPPSPLPRGAAEGAHLHPGLAHLQPAQDRQQEDAQALAHEADDDPRPVPPAPAVHRQQREDGDPAAHVRAGDAGLRGTAKGGGGCDTASVGDSGAQGADTQCADALRTAHMGGGGGQ